MNLRWACRTFFQGCMLKNVEGQHNTSQCYIITSLTICLLFDKKGLSRHRFPFGKWPIISKESLSLVLQSKTSVSIKCSFPHKFTRAIAYKIISTYK